ncbi:hypothetical protein FQN53_003079 [Emmonsiellopsis sp. PD_33]|nr:hypothetical protein FQN53_003079 [Emmonsiellopsis sp. PD_33]
METQNLHTASEYINNLLLARGLLRNGKPIDFARPEDAPGGTDATMARVINLVHDLVLRRDVSIVNLMRSIPWKLIDLQRESEQRENLATNIRALRSTEAKQTSEIERLQTKTTELARSLALAEGQERAFKATIHSAEATNRGLKDQVQRMKTSIQQIRAQCATDIRKRDVELQKLKSHLTDRQRGKRDGLGVTTITITPTPKTNLSRKPMEGGEGLESPGYSLKQETTEFLTRLCQDLSDENDAMIRIAKNTIHTLRNLQGLPDLPGKDSNELDTTEATAWETSGQEGSSATVPAPQYERLAAEMDLVLEQLRSLLTNPSFVPLEEVELRDNEIFRLRDGWEKMEERWKEAVAMMDGWHRRMAEGGNSVNIDELKQGMGLGLGVSEPKPVMAGPAQDNSAPSIYDDNATDEEDTESVGISEDVRVTSVRKTSPTKDVKQHGALGERSGNACPSRSTRRSKSRPGEGSECSDDELALSSKSKAGERYQKSTRRTESKIPKTSKPKASMSMAEKLATVESEARTAEEERRKSERKKRSNSSTRSKPRTRRRKSTLTPGELQELLGAGS